MRIVFLAAMLSAAVAAGAQTAPAANPPGTTTNPPSATVAPPAPPAVAVPVPTPAEAAAYKYQTAMVCRTSTPIGSLIAGHKTCKTRKQWDEQANDAERDARRMIEGSRTKTY